MKKITRIARTELSSLFFSPIAWFLLIIFLVHCSLLFSSSLDSYLIALKYKTLYSFPVDPATYKILADQSSGFFPAVLQQLYLYIPLLTMGLISREISSGSIRLLYSSPVKTSEIVFGKFLAMGVYNLILISILAIFTVISIQFIPNADIGICITGLLAIFLLLMTYSAIGLFMSSLTAYPVVAAICTFAMFAVLQYIGKLWQGIDFIRDITYYLSLGMRTQNMITGLVISRDVLYFIVITLCFLGFSILKLRGSQESISGWMKATRYGVMMGMATAVIYLSSRPALTGYLDVTANKSLTVTPATKALLKSTGNEALEMVAYVNLLDYRFSVGSPANRHAYLKQWQPYSRYKPIDFKFYYYYDTSATTQQRFERYYPDKNFDEIATEFARTNNVSLSRFEIPEHSRKVKLLQEENKTMFMQLRYKGKTTILRMFNDSKLWPSEEQFATAVAKLTKPSSIPQIAFLSGHLERSIDKTGDRDYQAFFNSKDGRGSLINNGFEVRTISEEDDIPDDLAVLVIADPKEAFSQSMLAKIQQYINKGGNLLIATEPGKQEIVSPLLDPLGLRIREGVMVQKNDNEVPDFLTGTLTRTMANMSKGAASLYKNSTPVVFRGAAPIEYERDSASFKILPLTMNTAEGWLKKGKLVNDSAQVEFNEAEGDQKGRFAVAVSLERQVNGRSQRIAVVGDADFMSADVMGKYSNYNHPFAAGMFKWLSGAKFPLEQSRLDAKDMDVKISFTQQSVLSLITIWILPGILLLAGTVLLIRRKRR